jgi:hypothetical protein
LNIKNRSEFICFHVIGVEFLFSKRVISYNFHASKKAHRIIKKHLLLRITKESVKKQKAMGKNTCFKQ